MRSLSMRVQRSSLSQPDLAGTQYAPGAAQHLPPMPPAGSGATQAAELGNMLELFFTALMPDVANQLDLNTI
ncbi:MAG: hypothetical protein VKJ06_02820 [Vampirovibrionales bacterium]|nr:hypothetical protein [Vampirovibrionales bacterium]